MNAIADSMHLLEATPETASPPRPTAPYAAHRDAVRRRDAGGASEDPQEDDEPPPVVFDGERVIDWTVRGIRACSAGAALPH